MKILVLICCIFCSFIIYGESSEVIKGEYLFVSLEEKEHQNIKVDIRKYGPVSLTVMNKTNSLLHFEKDPGLKQLQLLLKKRHYKGSIQPNFKYNLIQPVRPENDRRLRLKEIKLKQE